MISTTAILWDIDGTLLRAKGAGVVAFVEALSKVTGLEFPTGDMDMGGRTDPDIARRILRFAGAAGDHDELSDRLLAEMAAVYVAREAEFAARTAALPGVVEALTAFREIGALQTVVTGNIEPVARMKVTAAALAEHLLLDLGGYGSDHHDRAELVRTAVRRIDAAQGSIDHRSTWIVGDTPRDLACARAAGVRCVLVATGTHSFDSLRDLGADAVLPDLADVDRLLDVVSPARR
ncbi:MAG: haloacid dehalogenase-like hydrolase [Actinobacteria bacterium]|nr:haloacid dehalogenase-like hydrolase [Actinomycetota bacterium]